MLWNGMETIFNVKTDIYLFPTTYEIPIIKIQITYSKSLKKNIVVYSIYSQCHTRTRIH